MMLLGGGIKCYSCKGISYYNDQKAFQEHSNEFYSILFKVYRTDLITAMKIPDHQLLTPGTYFDLSDPWKQEWERGVQVVLCLKYITFHVLFILALR